MGSLQDLNANITSNNASVHDEWQAGLRLVFAHGARGTRLTTAEHHGPLYVQKPFYPEGADHAHVYLLHPPGGLVSGDNLEVDINLGNGAGALFTTPGACRIYRARPDRKLQRQKVSLSLASNSIAEWLPLETIAYPASRGEFTTRVSLPSDNSAKFIGWEITCLGLPASQFPFSSGELRQSFELWRDGRPLLIERLRLDAKDQALIHGRAGLQGNTVSGVMLLGPFSDATQRSQLLDSLRSQFNGADQLLGFSQRQQFIVARNLGNSAERIRQTFTQIWHHLRPCLIAKPLCVPRIWAC